MPFSYAPMYDVGESVGRQAPNRKLDVMLVQFFLNAIYISTSWPTPSIFRPDRIPTQAVRAVVPVNGAFDPGLITWIENFQKDANDQGFGPLAVDGKVTHAGTAWGSRQPVAHRRFAIQIMNEVLFKADRERFWLLHQDATVPGELQAELKAFRTNRDIKL